ncbi:hypothetical protein CPC08DRAFT_730937 [Agrocybe pediades]|nr:hypothetical protein CPC08DRAFT_730937 [Agrocybe pediades]
MHRLVSTFCKNFLSAFTFEIIGQPSSPTFISTTTIIPEAAGYVAVASSPNLSAMDSTFGKTTSTPSSILSSTSSSSSYPSYYPTKSNDIGRKYHQTHIAASILPPITQGQDPFKAALPVNSQLAPPVRRRSSHKSTTTTPVVPRAPPSNNGSNILSREAYFAKHPVQEAVTAVPARDGSSKHSSSSQPVQQKPATRPPPPNSKQTTAQPHSGTVLINPVRAGALGLVAVFDFSTTASNKSTILDSDDDASETAFSASYQFMRHLPGSQPAAPVDADYVPGEGARLVAARAVDPKGKKGKGSLQTRSKPVAHEQATVFPHCSQAQVPRTKIPSTKAYSNAEAGPSRAPLDYDLDDEKAPQLVPFAVDNDQATLSSWHREQASIEKLSQGKVVRREPSLCVHPERTTAFEAVPGPFLPLDSGAQPLQRRSAMEQHAIQKPQETTAGNDVEDPAKLEAAQGLLMLRRKESETEGGSESAANGIGAAVSRSSVPESFDKPMDVSTEPPTTACPMTSTIDVGMTVVEEKDADPFKPMVVSTESRISCDAGMTGVKEKETKMEDKTLIEKVHDRADAEPSQCNGGRGCAVVDELVKLLERLNINDISAAAISSTVRGTSSSSPVTKDMSVKSKMHPQLSKGSRNGGTSGVAVTKTNLGPLGVQNGSVGPSSSLHPSPVMHNLTQAAKPSLTADSNKPTSSNSTIDSAQIKQPLVVAHAPSAQQLSTVTSTPKEGAVASLSGASAATDALESGAIVSSPKGGVASPSLSAATSGSAANPVAAAVTNAQPEHQHPRVSREAEEHAVPDDDSDMSDGESDSDYASTYGSDDDLYYGEPMDEDIIPGEANANNKTIQTPCQSVSSQALYFYKKAVSYCDSFPARNWFPSVAHYMMASR